MTAENSLQKLLETIAELTNAMAQITRELRAEQKMVETLFAASYGSKWPTADMLGLLRTAYGLALAEAGKNEKPNIKQHIARIDALLQVDKSGPKPTLH